MVRYVGTEARLQKLCQQKVKADLDSIGWTTSWGPKVWKLEPESLLTGPDNVWFAATKKLTFPDGMDYNTCVVAISGTAVFSKHSWKEDFNIVHVVDFEQWTSAWPQDVAPPQVVSNIRPDGVYISEGTAKGVFTLMTEKAPEGTPAAGRTLQKYLASLSLEGVEKLIFTGHSLGGALSPTLALGLVEAGLIKSFDPQQGQALVFLTAGASPGNTNFASLFQKTFPPSSPTTGKDFRVWNCNLFNKYDIVPQAWCADRAVNKERNLLNIPGIYGNFPPLKKVSEKVQEEVGRSQSSGVLYSPIQGNMFETGKPWVPLTIVGFANDARKQHVKPYLDYIGGAQFSSPLPMEGIREKTLAERARDFPVLRFLQAEIAAEDEDEETPA